MKICIFGASSDSLAHIYYEEAGLLGRLLAEAGHTLVYGGGAGGLMGACAQGALHAGGKLIGIAPRYFDKPGVLLKENSEMILTETMAERKERMLELSDACIALPGGIGTMDELFEVITLRQIDRCRCKVALLNTDGFYTPLVRFLDQMTAQGFLSCDHRELLTCCSTPQDVMTWLL